MSDNELKDIWMTDNDGDRINLDRSQLKVNLKAKMKKINRSLFFRDAREIVAALAVMVFFGYESFVEDFLVLKLTNILIVVWSMYVIYRLLDVRKYKRVGDLSNSLKGQLEQQKTYFQKQAHLLNSVFVWYIAPPAVLFLISIIAQNYSKGFDFVGICISVITISIISYVIYVLNKKAAKATYNPLIENIDKVLVQLNEDSI